MKWIEAKTLLQNVSYGEEWFGIQYNMNLYRGCNHGCIYCDSRSDCYHIENFDEVKAKKNVEILLEKELMSKRKRGIIGIGSMSDPYNAFEKKYEITRKALLLIEKYGYGVCMQTKGILVTRDIDILKNIHKRASVCIGVTITTYDDTLSRILEPYAPVSSQRWEAVRKLSEEGIFTGILLSPVLPFITDTEENIRKMVFLASQNGAKFIYTYLGVTLRENQRVYYYDALQNYDKELVSKYKSTYKDKYLCLTTHQNLWNVFTEACEKYGILYKMEDIIKAYHKEKKQISFFE